jgi:hypothetical protein
MATISPFGLMLFRKSGTVDRVQPSLPSVASKTDLHFGQSQATPEPTDSAGDELVLTGRAVEQKPSEPVDAPGSDVALVGDADIQKPEKVIEFPDDEEALDSLKGSLAFLMSQVGNNYQVDYQGGPAEPYTWTVTPTVTDENVKLKSIQYTCDLGWEKGRAQSCTESVRIDMNGEHPIVWTGTQVLKKRGRSLPEKNQWWPFLQNFRKQWEAKAIEGQQARLNQYGILLPPGTRPQNENACVVPEKDAQSFFGGLIERFVDPMNPKAYLLSRKTNGPASAVVWEIQPQREGAQFRKITQFCFSNGTSRYAIEMRDGEKIRQALWVDDKKFNRKNQKQWEDMVLAQEQIAAEEIGLGPKYGLQIPQGARLIERDK